MLTPEQLKLIEDAKQKRKLYLDARQNLKEFKEFKKAQKILFLAYRNLPEFKDYNQVQQDLFNLLKSEELTDNDCHLIESELDSVNI